MALDSAGDPSSLGHGGQPIRLILHADRGCESLRGASETRVMVSVSCWNTAICAEDTAICAQLVVRGGTYRPTRYRWRLIDKTHRPNFHNNPAKKEHRSFANSRSAPEFKNTKHNTLANPLKMAKAGPTKQKKGS